MIKIELKNIKHMASLSEETHCYSAKLYADGVYVADVSNHGHGGSDETHPAKGKTWADIEAIEARVKAEYPKWKMSDGEEVETDLEIVCGDLVNDYLVLKDMKRALSRKVLWQGNDGKIWQSKAVKADQIPRLIEHFKTKDTNAKFLNELPEAEALALYRLCGR